MIYLGSYANSEPESRPFSCWPSRSQGLNDYSLIACMMGHLTALCGNGEANRRLRRQRFPRPAPFSVCRTIANPWYTTLFLLPCFPHQILYHLPLDNFNIEYQQLISH